MHGTPHPLFMTLDLYRREIVKNSPKPQLDLRKILPMAQLPGLPQSAVRLLELSKDPNNGPAECAVPIEIDLGLTSQVLRLVNSSYYGFASKISNVKLALALVSVRTITNFVLWSAVLSLMPNNKCGALDLMCLWQDSLRRALFARALAKLLGVKDSEDVFAAALLQDMAIPVLAKESPSSYMNLLVTSKEGKTRLSALEKHSFGWTHAQAAAMIAKHWNLPQALINMIENHTNIEKFADNPGEAKDMATLALSAFLPSVVYSHWDECRQFESFYEKIVPGCDPTIPELLDHIDKEYELFAPLVKLPVPAKSLTDRYDAETVLST
jgi:HD-like signal output (HDOD) protein